MNLFAHSGEITAADYGTEWLYLLAPLLVGFGVIAALIASGGSGNVFVRIANSLEKVTGMSASSAAAIGVGIWALIIAALGFYWDVAWHIELGRDEFIFTPAHMAILLGLLMIIAAGLAAVLFATILKDDTRIKVAGARVPVFAVPLTLLGVGAVLGFPLDEFWHQAYGIDVTMWGPTHLVMISGASLTPLALLLAYRAGSTGRRLSRFGRTLAHILAAALVVGLSTWTGEFDFGVPQFQALYHPVLVMAGSAMALTAVRIYLGTGAAVRAAVGAIVLRLLMALVLGTGLGLVIPRFPFYLGTAAVIELVAAKRTDARADVFCLTLGLATGTIGFATEWAWSQIWGRHPWTFDLMPGALLATVAAVAASFIGYAIGRILAGRPTYLAARSLIAAGAALLVALAAPLPRRDADIQATVLTERTGDRAFVEVQLDPARAADKANWFEVLSWQGGAMENHPLVEVEEGTYRTERAAPIGGEWKTVIRMASDDVLVGSAVYLPADEEIGASEVPLKPERRVDFVRDTEFLMREATEGPAWPALVAYSVIAVLAVTWIASLIYGYARAAIRKRSPSGPRHAHGAAA